MSILVKKKRRIALVVPALESSGGVSAVARFVLETIHRSGWLEPRLVSLSCSARDDLSVALSKPKSWFKGVNTKDGIWCGQPFTRVGSFASEFEFQRYCPRLPLVQILKDCDLVQVVCGSPAWANTVIGFDKPVSMQVATLAKVERRLRNAKSRGALAMWRKAMTPITSIMENRALRMANAIQVENKWMFKYAKDINKDRNVDLICAPPGIDTDFFRPIDARNLKSRPYILCVGRMSDPRKNVNLLLNAYALLPNRLRMNVRLIMAGSSAPSDFFWQEVERLKLNEQVSFILKPNRTKLLGLYQKASVFALPSDEEGLGVVLLEAMACALPVISTRCGGPENIITDNLDGYLIPRGDAENLSKCLTALLENPDRNMDMGRKARETIVQRYDNHIAGKAFMDVWDRLIE